MSKCERCGIGCKCDELEAMEAELLVGGFESIDLDDMVHEAASRMGSSTNNAGMVDQIEFLLENGFNTEVLLEELGEKKKADNGN
jgi:hypothetical protein